MYEYGVLIEKNLINAESILGMIVAIDLKVIIFSEVEESINFVSSNSTSIAFIIIDLNIDNETNIYKYLDFLKSNNHQMGVILISDLTEPTVFINAIRYGVDDFIEKSSGIEQLNSSINKLMNKRRISQRNNILEEERTKFQIELSQVLNKTSNLLASLINSSKEGIFIADGKGIILEVNKAFTDLLYFLPQDLIGRNIYDILKTEVSSTVFEDIQQSLHDINRLFWRGEITLRTKDGNLLGIILSISSVTNQNGEFINHLGIILDNKERKTLEKEFTKLEEIKTKFIGITAHELRTPIHQISMAYNIIKGSSNLPSNVSLIIDKTEEAIKRLKNIVDSLADFVAFSTNRFKLEIVPLEIIPLVKNAVESLSSILQEKHIVIDIGKLKNLRINGDKKKIEECMKQVIHNAIKFSFDHGIIQIFNIGNNCIVIKDNGIGIKPEMLERIFDPFYEETDVLFHNTDINDHVGKGLGLGMTLCKLIIDAHKGKIRAESQGRNMGAEVHIEFSNIWE